MTTKKDENHIREQVRTRYSEIAKEEGSCCESTPLGNPEFSTRLGYSNDELSAVPDGANMGLGCGNPQAIAQMKPGEVVVDLGCGGGFDCFLAAKQVGEAGKVIGVDMTPEMLAKARDNARKGDYTNVEFRLGEIEHLPVADILKEKGTDALPLIFVDDKFVKRAVISPWMCPQGNQTEWLSDLMRDKETKGVKV